MVAGHQVVNTHRRERPSKPVQGAIYPSS